MNAFMCGARIYLLGAALMLVQQNHCPAQSTNQPKASVKKEEKKPAAHPIHGKLNGVDRAGKTVSIGKSTYYITAETRVQKAGKPATLDDAVIGEQVGGYVKPAPDGRMVATSLTLGPKPDAKAAKKQK